MIERFPGIRIVLVDGDSDGDKYVVQIRALPATQQPHLLLRLPDGEAFEMSLAHGLEDDQAFKVLEQLKNSCSDICENPPEGTLQTDLVKFLVNSKLKKKPLLRSVIADAFRVAAVLPPIVNKLCCEIATAISAPPDGMVEKRLGVAGEPQ
jgi:hypothetical protein